MSCAPCNPCQAPCWTAPEDFGLLFPSLVGPPGAPGGQGTYLNSLAELRLLNPAEYADGYQAWVAGYGAVNDGGGGFFSYLSTGTDADNDGTIIAPSTGIGRWFRIYAGVINAKWFGATGAGVADDTTALQNALNTAALGDGESTARGGSIYIPVGVYLVTSFNLLRGTTVFGDGPNSTILRRTATTGYGLQFDSTGLAVTDVPDWVAIKDLSIFQQGVASAGGGIYVNGATSAAKVMIENVRVEDCYRGIVTYNNEGSYFKGVEVVSAVVEGFYHVGGLNCGVHIDCRASDCGTSGFYGDMMLSCNLISCASNNNDDNGFYLTNCNYSGLYNCCNEGNEKGAILVGCVGMILDNFFTQVDVMTDNAVVLDGGSSNELRNLASNHTNAAYGLYMVSAINSSVSNTLTTGFVTNAWPSGLTNDLDAFDMIRTDGGTTFGTRMNFRNTVLIANLPVVVGAAGELWNNAGIVEVSP